MASDKLNSQTNAFCGLLVVLCLTNKTFSFTQTLSELPIVCFVLDLRIMLFVEFTAIYFLLLVTIPYICWLLIIIVIVIVITGTNITSSSSIECGIYH